MPQSSASLAIGGIAETRFSAVRDAFAENFAQRGELGAAVAVYVEGRLVVDLWGGIADRASSRPWQENTMVVIFSSTKGVTALCAHVLASRGQIDLDAPVARYWPEFAQADKGSIPVRMLLDHQAGLAALDAPMRADAIYDWETMTAALAAQRPHWAPGTAHGYHAVTFGFLVGEVVRRVSGMSLGTFLREAIAGPLGLDLYVGLPPELEPRVATVRLPPLSLEPTPMLRALADRSTLTSKAFLNPPGLLRGSTVNARATHAAEIPAANAIGTARGLARLYAALACDGRLDGVEIVSGSAAREMSVVESTGDDLVLLLPTRFSSGFMKSIDNRPGDSAVLGPNPTAFGHAGAGGSFGMADPEAKVSIAYVMNQLGHGVLLNARGQALIDAVYTCLGP